MESNSEFVYVIFYIFIFFILILISIVLFVIQSRKQILKKELEKKELEIKLHKEVLQATILSQEKERERIAQDLHDEISSKLIAVSLNLHLLNSTKTPNEEKATIISNIISINKNTIENSRKIAHNLLPPVLEKFGLEAALEELIQDYENSKSVEIEFINSINLKKIKKEEQLQIFRIIQESINNSLKHGKASLIKIHFKDINNQYNCIYSDNGIGFDSDSVSFSKGLGMLNIESRIEYLNGNYTIKSERNKGIYFQFTFCL
jgi:signal transduction histidine kinase